MCSLVDAIDSIVSQVVGVSRVAMDTSVAQIS